MPGTRLSYQATLSAGHALRLAFLLLLTTTVSSAAPPSSPRQAAFWISSNSADPCPVNQFTYFRKVVHLEQLTGDLTLHVAADSNAHVWINGVVVRRKVTRYFEKAITTETIDPRRLLHPGDNTVVILNHSWGPITTFQRSGCAHAGIFVSSAWLHSDSTWKTQTAREFAPNTEQILGVPPSPTAQGDHRIRFAQFVYGDKLPPAAMFTPHYVDSSWTAATEVTNGPWSDTPPPVETPGQRELPVTPTLLLAQGRLVEQHVTQNDPLRIEAAMLHATYQPEGPQALNLTTSHTPGSFKLSGHAGETRYITIDFGRPVHGFPFLTATAIGTPPVIDFAYGELSYSLSSGKSLLASSGWLNPEAIVGKGYIDRYYARPGLQHFELPDERTARWLTIHVFFPQDGSLTIQTAGFISSQYPVDVRGSFHSSDKRLDQVVQLSLEHAIVSMSDTYVDTPGREDGQWLEDARLRAQLAAQWFGDTKLRQVLLRLAAQSQVPDGRLHPFPPSNYPIVANADWSAEWVGALYDDYLWTGDTTRLRLYWPQLQAWWRQVMSQVNSSGLWCDDHVFADIRVGVHPSAGQSSGIASAQIIQRLTLSIAMAKAIHQDQQAAAWQTTYTKMLSAFQQQHLVAAHDDKPLHVDDVAAAFGPLAARGFSQAAQVMAIESGLLTHAQSVQALDYTFPAPAGSPPAGVARWNNPTYLYRALNALTISGLSDRALQHLLERFSPYLPGSPDNPTPLLLQGAHGGPLPEYWISRRDLALSPSTLNPAQPIDPTGSHGWNAVALVWLHDSLLGVRILEPGGALLHIHPDAAGLAFVSGTTITPHGPVHVLWTPARQTLTITLPTDTRAVVQLPAALTLLQKQGKLHIPSGCSATADQALLCAGSSLSFSTTDPRH